MRERCILKCSPVKRRGVGPVEQGHSGDTQRKEKNRKKNQQEEKANTHIPGKTDTRPPPTHTHTQTSSTPDTHEQRDQLV